VDRGVVGAVPVRLPTGVVVGVAGGVEPVAETSIKPAKSIPDSGKKGFIGIFAGLAGVTGDVLGVESSAASYRAEVLRV
jgi:hypothetical protein